MREEHEAIIEDLQRIIVRDWSEENKNHFFTAGWGDKSLIEFHHTFGRYIRNNYNLWEIPWEPELIDGVDHSPEHPDQISMTLIEELWKRGLNFEESK